MSIALFFKLQTIITIDVPIFIIIPIQYYVLFGSHNSMIMKSSLSVTHTVCIIEYINFLMQ